MVRPLLLWILASGAAAGAVLVVRTPGASEQEPRDHRVESSGVEAPDPQLVSVTDQRGPEGGRSHAAPAAGSSETGETPDGSASTPPRDVKVDSVLDFLVRDEFSGAPVAGIEVSGPYESTTPVVVTDRNGRAGVPWAGEGSYGFKGNGYSWDYIDVERLDLPVHATVRQVVWIDGHVAGVGGLAEQGKVTVAVEPHRATWRAQAQVGPPDGVFTSPPARYHETTVEPDGSWTVGPLNVHRSIQELEVAWVSVELDDHGTGRRQLSGPIVLRPGERARVEDPWAAGGPASVTLVYPNGVVVPSGLRLSLLHKPSGIEVRSRVGPGGRADFHRVPSRGAFEGRLGLATFQTHGTALAASPTITLEGFGFVEGRVMTDTPGDPKKRKAAFLERDGIVTACPVNGDGDFRLDGVPLGEPLRIELASGIGHAQPSNKVRPIHAPTRVFGRSGVFSMARAGFPVTLWQTLDSVDPASTR